MKIEKTFFANISLGFREKYTDVIHNITEVENIIQQYCDHVGLCVTITPTKFIYKDGFEDGCFICLIQYPRFPTKEDYIKDTAINIAKIFLKKFKQLRISIICSDKTYMIEKEDL